MKRKVLSVLLTLVLVLSFSLVTAAPVAAATIDLAVNDLNPWTDGAFTFENISPGGDPMAFDFKLHNVGDDPGILTFSMEVSENDMVGAPYPNMSADEFASLIYVEAVSYQYIWLDHPDKDTHPEGYIGDVRDDLDKWIGMDLNVDGKVSLYEICQVGTIPYSDDDPIEPLEANLEGNPLNGAEITYFIEFQLGDSLEGGAAGGAILTGVDNASEGDGINVTITATLGSDEEQSSGNVFQALGVVGPVLNVDTDVSYGAIQLAIDDGETQAGHVISVAAGTYTERVDINKSLTLEGANAGIPGSGTRGPESIINPQWLEIFDGDTGKDFGVLIYGAGTIATFDGFTVENYHRVGIQAGTHTLDQEEYPNPSVVHILNNIVSEPIGQHNNNCIGVGFGTTGTIIGNEVFGAVLESPDWSGSGILVASSNNVLVSKNYVHDCEGGIQICGYPVGSGGPAVSNVIEYNLSQGNESGIVAQQNAIGTIIRYNDALNNASGIVSVGWFNSPGYFPSGTEIHYNNIVGNLEYGVKSSTWDEGGPEEVDAKKNYWGDPSGPDGAQVFVPGEPGTYTGVLPGDGDIVSTKVKCMPWLTRPFEKVLGDDIAYFGVSFPALKGWNIVSAPLALDAHVTEANEEPTNAYDHPANTWGGLRNLGKIAEGDDYALKLHYTLATDGITKVYTPIYYYDSDPDSPTFGWRKAYADTEINPVDAYYIRMMASDSFPVLFSPDVSVPSKDLYHGWNLVGCAYMDVMFADDMSLLTALATIATVSSPAGDVKGYAQVVSPPVNQLAWIYIPPPPDGGTYIVAETDKADKGKILMGKGYWVFMENPGTLAGLTFTPISLGPK